MPSLHSIFFAAAALAMLSSALPVPQLSPSTLEKDLVAVIDNIVNTDLDFGVVLPRAGQPTDVLANTVGKAAEGVTGGPVKLSSVDPLPASAPGPKQNVIGGSGSGSHQTRDTPVSLPVALKSVNENESNGKNTLNVQTLGNIIGEVQAIVCELLNHAQLLVGESIDVVLSLEGQVLPLTDVATLLQTVLTLVAAILTCVMNLVASADANVILPLVASLGPFFCQALQCIFGLVPGLLNTVVGLLGGIMAALISLKLDAVVALLKAN